MLNGGHDVEVDALVRPGDRIIARSRCRDIYHKGGKTGP
jgi:hypothetical protein